MISIDSLLAEAFVEENRAFFEGAKVQKIQQPTRKELILHLRSNFESKKFYINIHPRFHHAALMNKENEAKRNLKIPAQPPMFCMLLRKHMEGAKIVRINKPENERIIELFFENYDEIGAKVEECLSIELMGKHSNIVLYNTDNNIILGCAHNIGSEKSKERELAGGLPYIYPPKQDKRELLRTRSDSFKKIFKKSPNPLKKVLAENFFGLTQILAGQIAEKIGINGDSAADSLKEEEMLKLFAALHEFFENPPENYFISRDFEYFSPFESPVARKYTEINALIDDYFAYHQEKFNLKNLKATLCAAVQKELKRLKNSFKNLQKEAANKEKAEKYRLKADLIMANLYNLKKGEKIVVLSDFEGENQVEIELDENISPVENANRYYARYNKAKKAYQIAEELAQKAQGEIEYFEELMFSIELAQSMAELEEIEEEIIPAKKDEKSKKKEKQTTVQKLDINGFNVYVGKNNKQNDFIFSKISSPEDLWFHALNVPGAHILIKVQDKEPPDEVLLRAAEIAKEFSSAKNSGKVPVIYTKRKYLKKPPAQKGGMVTYRNETEIVVE